MGIRETKDRQNVGQLSPRLDQGRDPTFTRKIGETYGIKPRQILDFFLTRLLTQSLGQGLESRYSDFWAKIGGRFGTLLDLF